MKRDLGAFSAVIVLLAASAHGYVPQDSKAAPAVEDEYVRCELLEPSTHSFRIAHDLSVVTPGVTTYAEAIPVRSQASDISVIDLMSGTPLVFRQANSRIDITLARPVPKGGQARIRITETLTDSTSYRQSAQDIDFEHPTKVRRVAVVLPRGFELIRADVPVQVIQEADGRIAANFMNLYPATMLPTIVPTIRARALKNPPAVPQHADASTETRAPQPTPDTAPPSPPMDQIRVTERAIQDREIVYFLKPPETHAFSLYHDYTAAREGEHQYVNVVRTGSAVSDPSAMILDTGEVLKTRTLTGADIAREKIEINERVDPDTQVVLIPFTPVKKGTSIRLRISETYTDPARYALIDGQLMWHRSFGRNRNDMVLPDGWYLTTSSIPAVISTEPDGRIRLSFWNGRPDNVDVFVKGSRR
jgi:hypothetical protein